VIPKHQNVDRIVAVVWVTRKLTTFSNIVAVPCESTTTIQRKLIPTKTNKPSY